MLNYSFYPVMIRPPLTQSAKFSLREQSSLHAMLSVRE